MTFTRYVCWKNDEIKRIAPIDVGGIEHADSAHNAVFLATHQPIPHLRSSGGLDGPWSKIEEDALLAAFQAPMEGESDSRILIFTGPVGTGKSHAIKWLHAMSPDSDDWHQVYIEKSNTSLRKVVETILAGMSGEPVDQLREELSRAESANKTLEEAMTEVVDELSRRIEHSDLAKSTLDEREKYARRLLPDLLHDKEVRSLLSSEGGAIRRITELSYKVGPTPDNEYDVWFAEGDLPLRISNLGQRAPEVRNAITRLEQSQGLRNAAVKVINLELAPAKVRVFLGNTVQLTEIFDDIRTELKKQGKGLTIYIEDFVLLHGIDRELANIFTATTGADRKRCPLRVAIAVTTGFLRDGPFETLVSRSSVFSLSLHLNGGSGTQIDPDLVQSFVGRYLNAFRLGEKALDAAHRNVDLVGKPIPNACNSCNHQSVCHATFGTSQDGFGLYPFTQTAVRNFIADITAHPDVSGIFDPRRTIRGLFHDVLRQAGDELPRGEFPSDDVASSIDQQRSAIDLEIRNQLGEAATGLRWKTLLGFWASRPVTEVAGFDAQLLSAFDVPVMEGSTPPRSGGGGGDVGSGAISSRRSVDPPPKTDEFKDWVDGKVTLKAETARTIRQYIYAALIGFVLDGSSGLRVARVDTWKHKVGLIQIDDRCVEIDAATGGGGEVERPFVIDVDRTVPNGVMLRAMVVASQNGGWSAQDLEHYIRFRSLIDVEGSRLVHQVRQQSDPSGSIQWAQLGAVVSRPEISKSTTRSEQLESILRPLGDPNPRSGKWDLLTAELRRSKNQVREQLVDRLSTSKGLSPPSVLDAAVLVRGFKRLPRIDDLGSIRSKDELVIKSCATLADKMSAALAEQERQLEKTLGPWSDQLEGLTDWDAVVKSVNSFLGAANHAGLLSHSTARSDLTDQLSSTSSDVLQTINDLSKRLKTRSLTVWDFVDDPIRPIDGLRSFIDALDGELAHVAMRIGREASDKSSSAGAGDLANAYRRLAQSLGSLKSEVRP